jgi:hypothetical protein
MAAGDRPRGAAGRAELQTQARAIWEGDGADDEPALGWTGAEASCDPIHGGPH